MSASLPGWEGYGWGIPSRDKTYEIIWFILGAFISIHRERGR